MPWSHGANKRIHNAKYGLRRADLPRNGRNSYLPRDPVRRDSMLLLLRGLLFCKYP